MRRPLVRTGGRTEQLPAGDTIAGVPVAMPAYTAAGMMLRLSLNTNYALPVQLAAGGSLNVQVITNG